MKKQRMWLLIGSIAFVALVGATAFIVTQGRHEESIPRVFSEKKQRETTTERKVAAEEPMKI